MDTDQIEFLTLIRDKVDLLIPKVSLIVQLIEISEMISSRIRILEQVDGEE